MSKSLKVAELMADLLLNPNFEGFSTADDWAFAIDISGGMASGVGDYEVLQLGVSGVDASLEAQTEDSSYIRGGQSTLKTGTQRTFSVSGDRYIGSAAQDFMFSHAVKFGTGQSVVVPYVYFNILTGKGEKGMVSVIVNNDASGEAGSKSTIDVEFRTTGQAPVECQYRHPVTLGVLNVVSAPGTETGRTALTVTPTLAEGDHYRIRVGGEARLPVLNEDLSSWDEWNGTDELPAAAGAEIVLAEVNAAGKAKKAGTTAAVVAA